MADLGYDEETGVIYQDGKGVTTYLNPRNNYLYFSGQPVHRLAFEIKGIDIKGYDVDHIDGNRLNNIWSNLRKVTRQQNLFNRTCNKNKEIQIKNVYLHKPSGRYRVKMKINGITKHFGYYDDLELAALVASEVQRKYHGEYARNL